MSDSDRRTERREDGIDAAGVHAFIDRWKNSGGSELANFQMFAGELCELLGVAKPDPSQSDNEYNDYTFERRIDFRHDDGGATPGRIDLYKRGCFVMEAKQSAKRKAKKGADPRQTDMLPEDAMQAKAGAAVRGARGWDRIMRAAKRQAEDYARALPPAHGWPPFILVVDVGHVFEVYADFSGQGKNYAQFPDREGYRIPLTGLRDPEARARLRAVWTDPLSLDPARRSAEVTRDIAERLARIARSLEGRGRHPEEVAEFLMRCLFTMFAEDVGLLPEKGFEDLLGRMVDTPQHFAPALESLWQVMDEGGYAPQLNAVLKRFNGSLFRNRRAIPLEADEIRELHIAAGRDWRDVEPAIFGALLERALDERKRAELGAHYTPRAYVERLVVPAIVEPLRADWEAALAEAHALDEAGDRAAALRRVKEFHRLLCTTRVLDPACGTGNFLYVALELMKRLEGEALDALEGLGEDAPRFVMEGETVGPRQFYGLELNPRAVAIADLVLWLGYLKWQLRTLPPDRLSEPVLHAYGTIREQDAVLAWDRQELLCGEDGRPLSRWDGVTVKRHPVTGEEVPDPDAQVELYRYENPRPAAWPEAEFVVGNPPFIGGKDMRMRLGDGYAEACWKARPKVPGGADFVMHFWDEAATRLLAQAEERANEPAAPLRFHHHQFGDADLFPARDRAAYGGEGAAGARLRRAGPSVAEGGGQGGRAHRHDRRRARPGRGQAGGGRAGRRAQHGYAGRRTAGADGPDRRQPEGRRGHSGGPAAIGERPRFQPRRQAARSGLHRDAAAGGGARTRLCAGAGEAHPALPQRPGPRPASARRHGHRPVSTGGG